MIEYSDDLSTKYDGSLAVKQRIITRLKHTTNDIPYYERGVDISEFVYGSQLAAIKLGLRDFGPSVSFNSENQRVQCYDVSISVGDLINTQ